MKMHHIFALVLVCVAMGGLAFIIIKANFPNFLVRMLPWEKKLMEVFGRYVAWKSEGLEGGKKYVDPRIENGDLVVTVTRDILGERIDVGEFTLVKSTHMERRSAMLEILDSIMEEAKVLTPEELDLFLSNRGC